MYSSSVQCNNSRFLISTNIKLNFNLDVYKRQNPYRYVEARGRVVETETGDTARANIDELAQKYTGADYANPIGSERVIVRIGVDHVHKNGI